MALEWAAELLDQSLNAGESREDFAALVEVLTELRAPFHPSLKRESVERVSAALLCLLVFRKPDEYRAAMGKFRYQFRGITKSGPLRTVFAACVLPSALTLTETTLRAGGEIWRPSLFFTPFPLLVFKRTLPALPVPSPLEGWF